MPTVAGIELPQGDPGAVESAAASFNQAAADFGSTGETAQHALGAVPGWRGVASISFRDRCGTYAGAAAAGHETCRQAATALRRFARELEDAQTRVRQLQRQAEDCVHRIDAADRRAADAAARQSAAEARGAAAAATAGADGGALRAAAERDAQDAGAERGQAERDAAAARDELERLRERARVENEQIKAKARAAAAAVRGAGRGMPRVDFPPPAATPHAVGGPGIDWRNVALAFRLVSSAALIKGVYTALPYIETARSWQAVAPGSPLASWATQLMFERFPTWNNGLAGRGAGAFLSRFPGKAGVAGEFIGDAGRATPFFTKVGIGTGIVGVGLGGYNITRDITQHKSGDQLASDITGTAFSGATVAFLVAPNPVTGGAVIVTGLAWGGAEAWQHREAIGHAAKKTGEFLVGAGEDAGKFIWDTSAPGVLWNNRHAIGHALDSGADLAESGLHTAESGLGKVGHALNPMNW
jgi:hypothetical protein